MEISVEEKKVVRVIANLLVNDLFPRLKRAGIPVEQSPVSPGAVALLAICKERGWVSTARIRQEMDERIAEWKSR